jgi:DNA-binding transcriptional LysR family regulator
LKADLEGGLLEPILAAYREQPEAIPVEVSFGDWDLLAERLRDGRADVALIYTDFDDDGLDHEVLMEEPLVVALAATHPLAGRESLTLADLEPDHRPAASGQLWWPVDSATPPRFDGLSQMIQLIELGELVAFLSPSVAARYRRPGLVTRPLDGEPRARLVVAWPRAATSPALAAFVRAATDLAG